MITMKPLGCLIVICLMGCPRTVLADSDPKPNADFGQLEYYGNHGSGDEYYKGQLLTFLQTLLCT